MPIILLPSIAFGIRFSLFLLHPAASPEWGITFDKLSSQLFFTGLYRNDSIFLRSIRKKGSSSAVHSFRRKQ